jgi:hypothetical protein
MNEKYIGEVVEVDGELYLEFPLELIEEMGWDEQTLLEWIIEDEQVTLREKENGRESKT